MRDLRQASDINGTVFYRLLRYLISITLICRGHLCVFRVVSFSFLAQLRGSGQSLPHKGDNFTPSCRVTASPEANVNPAFLMTWKVSSLSLQPSSTPCDIRLTLNGASTFDSFTLIISMITHYSAHIPIVVFASFASVLVLKVSSSFNLTMNPVNLSHLPHCSL